MHYDLTRLPIDRLFAPVAAATAALARLDERIARSVVGHGWIERMHFSDAAASLWIDGELVHLEDLVLHDAGMGIRAPTHELTIAHDVLRSRRKIFSHPPGWALGVDGLRNLRGGAGREASTAQTEIVRPVASSSGEEESADQPLARELAEMDAVLARSEAVLSGNLVPPTSRRERDPLVYETDWDEDERLAQWQVVFEQTNALPPVLRAVLLIDAWNRLEVLQRAPWLGRLLAAGVLREAGITGAHLAAVNLGLKLVPRERRASRDRDSRLHALLDGLSAGADEGLRQHDRLLLARQQMQHRLIGRRRSSRLPALIDLVLSRPMVSANMIADELGVTPQGALGIAAELNLRELTGRGRFRAWGVL